MNGKNVTVTMIFFIFVVIILQTYFNPGLKDLMNSVTTEMEAIPQFPNSILISQGYNKSIKTKDVQIGGVYQSGSEFVEIKKYYLEKLNKLGWKFIQEEVTAELNIISLFFKKDNYILELSYYNNQSDESWNYTIYITGEL